MTSDIHDLTPEDAFGISPQERAELDAAHQQIVRNFQRLLDEQLDDAMFFRRMTYYYLSVAESPLQLEETRMLVITDFGYHTDGQYRLPTWRRPRLLTPGTRASIAAGYAGDLADDDDGRYAVERAALRPTQLCGSEWLGLWREMQQAVLLDQTLQHIAVASAAA